jgi:hypothetical protein
MRGDAWAKGCAGGARGGGGMDFNPKRNCRLVLKLKFIDTTFVIYGWCCFVPGTVSPAAPSVFLGCFKTKNHNSHAVMALF